MEELDIVEDNYGICYYKKGTKTLHRLDGPAYCRANLHLETLVTSWFINGLLHREDGPATEHCDGYKAWYLNGEQHRLDGPAVEFNGYKEWWVHDYRHREDGPAIEGLDGHKEWIVWGQLHRLDGPAVVSSTGDKNWWINGIQLFPEKEAVMNMWWENKNEMSTLR